MVRELERALSEFEARVGGEWKETTAGEEVLDEMSESAKDRLQDLGYID